MPGEDHKTIHGAEHVLRSLAQSGAERGDLVVAVGGGVVGDMAGFCAAVYQRGMRHAQVPTTLVAQVDSAYGGKTGVDLPEERTTSAPTTSRRRCCATRPRSTRCRWRRWRPATWRSSRPR